MSCPACRYAANSTGREVGFAKAGIIARKSTTRRANHGHVQKLAAIIRHRMETIGGRDSVCQYAAGGTDREVGSAETESTAKDEDPSSKLWARP